LKIDLREAGHEPFIHQPFVEQTQRTEPELFHPLWF
jgi:hypothetical protein